MFVDKKGKEITAGCKILIGSHTFTVWNLDEEVRPAVKEWLAECATIVESDQESDMNLNFTSHLPLEPSPIKEWLNIPPASEGE